MTGGRYGFEAAEKSGQCASNYIGEAVYMRLKAEGFNPDRTLFVNEWKEINKKTSNTAVTANR